MGFNSGFKGLNKPSGNVEGRTSNICDGYKNGSYTFCTPRRTASWWV